MVFKNKRVFIEYLYPALEVVQHGSTSLFVRLLLGRMKDWEGGDWEEEDMGLQNTYSGRSIHPKFQTLTWNSNQIKLQWSTEPSILKITLGMLSQTLPGDFLRKADSANSHLCMIEVFIFMTRLTLPIAIVWPAIALSGMVIALQLLLWSYDVLLELSSRLDGHDNYSGKYSLSEFRPNIPT